MPDLTENISAARVKPALEAVVKDEERRERAKDNLVRALQSYINKLDRVNDRDQHRETELFSDYARENYASRGGPYFESMPPIDPCVLFRGFWESSKGDLTDLGDLSGLPTIGDVFDLVKHVKVQRPNHWPDPIAYHPDESPEMRSVLRQLTLRKHESFESLLEEPWGGWFRRQIDDCIKECVLTTRQEYELRFPNPPEQIEPARPKLAALANTETRKRRYAVLKQYRADHDLDSMADLARRFAMSVTAIRGMVRGDRSRYSEEKLATLLNSIGVSPGEW